MGVRKTEVRQGQSRRSENAEAAQAAARQDKEGIAGLDDPVSLMLPIPCWPDTPAQGSEGLQACDPHGDSGSARVGPAS